MFDKFFDKKINEAIINRDTQIIDNYQEMFEAIEKFKIQICYYDYSSVSVVKSGKITDIRGWYIKENNKSYNLQNRPKKLFDFYIDAVQYAIRKYNG